MAELALARPLASNSKDSIKFMHEDLARSGLVPEDLDAYPVAPIAMGTCPGYCIPYKDYRMYRTRYMRDENKYIAPPRMVGVWWSPKQKIESFRNAPTLYIIEGEKKAAKFVKTWPHLPTLGIGGAWMHSKKNEAGIRLLLPDILKCLAPGMNVIAIFDGDIINKPDIQKAAYALNQLLIQQQCTLKLFRPPTGKGVDDWLVACPQATLHDLHEITVEQLAISRKDLYNALELTLSDKGTPIANETNIMSLIQDYFSGSLVHDKRRGVKLNSHHVSDTALLAEITKHIQKEHIANAYVSRIRTALDFYIQEIECDLVKSKFLALQWDEEPRLNSWGAEYFTSDMPEYCAEWGRLLMTAMVFRVIQPGIKVDYIPILVGPQNIGKTTFFEDLAVFDGERYYHSCSNITPDVGDAQRTQCIAFNKNIVVDLGEGAAFNPRKVDQENFKQFITQTQDEYRPVYSKSTMINLRSFIFVGTSNRRDQITDRSGSRRFLPIHVTSIKRLPYEEKLQILAEVIAKRDEIITSKWYDLNVDWDKMPIPLKESMPFITDPQTLVNSQFTRGDDFTDFVNSILEAGEAAQYRNTTYSTTAGEMFISSVYLAARYQGKLPLAHASSRLSDLTLSPLFPWILEAHKPRLSMLKVPDEFLVYYTDGIKDPNKMLTGFKVRKKT
jgi:hypothetical protein